jgi:hypothetical protein
MRPVTVGAPRTATSNPFDKFVLAAFREIEQASHAERFIDVVSGYTVTNYTKTRTLDASTATAGDIANFLATLIADLKAAEVVKG